jgi:hypothetical protein
MDPHVFYLAPEPWRDAWANPDTRGATPDRFNRWTIQAMDKAGRLSDEAKAFIAGRYDGEISYMDHELGRLLTALDALAGPTLLAVISDHGEELWEHGGFEHNHSLHEEVTRALLWVRIPGQSGQKHDTPATLADLVPTLLPLVGLPTPTTDGIDLLAGPGVDRGLPLGHVMYGPDRWGVVQQGHKYILNLGTGEERLYDLDADPGETQDLAPSADLDTWRTRLAAAHGWPGGSGWRVALPEGHPAMDIRWTDAVQAAGLIDPEATADRRSNQAWGERPDHAATGLASVDLHEGTIQISAGAGDVLQVLAGAPPPDLPATAAGVLFVPPLPIESTGQASPAETEALKALGYLGP